MSVPPIVLSDRAMNAEQAVGAALKLIKASVH
jgi:hypothetical protein